MDFSGLSKNGMIVKFTKVDGTERTMRCTTNLSLVPTDMHPKTEGYGSEDVKRVFDLDKQGWRSFRIASVIEAKNL